MADDSSLHFFDAEEEYSNAISGALYGEILLDSPVSNYYSEPQQHSPNNTTMTTSTHSQDDDIPTSEGIMAQGLAWVQSQRNKRHRKYLQQQALLQIEKIKQAHQTQGDLKHNTIFQNLHEMTPSDDTTDDNNAHVSQSGDGVTVQLDIPDEDDAFIPPVRIEHEEEETELSPFLLSAPLRQQVAKHVLPKQIAYAKWIRLYSLVRDGDSFDTCLRKLQNQAPTLIVVRTAENELLGGFADASWETPGLSGAQYYGGSTSCLFRVKEKKIVCYKWTGANRYIQLCDTSRKMLALGGGDGAFGLALEQDFQHGSTGKCATFDNEQLAEKENFQILDVEIYGFLIGQFNT